MGETLATDSAFETLYRRHERALLAFCRSVLRSDDDARDALQNTAIKALAGVRHGSVRTNPRAWLFRIAHNECMNLVRARPPAHEELNGEPALEPGPAARAVLNEELRHTVADIGALPARARETLLLREAAGLSYREIAAVLGIRSGAARQAVSEARVSLRADRAAREADCDLVRALLADPDGRRRRSSAARAHLRGCPSCRAWAGERGARSHGVWGLAVLAGPVRWIAALLGQGDGVVAARLAGESGAGRGLAAVATAVTAAVAIGSGESRPSRQATPTAMRTHTAHKVEARAVTASASASASATAGSAATTTSVPASRATHRATAKLSAPAPRRAASESATLRTETVAWHGATTPPRENRHRSPGAGTDASGESPVATTPHSHATPPEVQSTRTVYAPSPSTRPADFAAGACPTAPSGAASPPPPAATTPTIAPTGS